MEIISNRSRKNIAFKLIATMIIFLLLFFTLKSQVHANRQSPIRNLTIDTLSSTVQEGVTIPTVTISWEAPETSQIIEVGANLINGADIHETENFEIRIRNITFNETRETTVGTVDGGSRSFTIPSGKLRTGSLYEVKVYAKHSHMYQDEDGVIYRQASYTDEEIPSRIFLTPLNIETKASGDKIIITFDDAGSWIKYKIFYEPLSDTPFSNNFNEELGLTVTRGATNVRSFVETSNGISRSRLEYTLSGRSDIKPGKAYAIAVLPYDIPSDDYTISISPENNVYSCATQAPFAITEQSDDYLQLSWKGLNSIENKVKEVLIYMGSEPGNMEQFARVANDNATDVEYYLVEKPENIMYFQIKVTYKNDSTVAHSEVLKYDPDTSRIIPARPDVSATYNNGLIDVEWSAFYFENHIRFDTYYDILITDSIDISTDLTLNIDEGFIVNEGTQVADKIITTGKYKNSYGAYLTEVYDASGDVKGYVAKDIELNKVYYVRVVAKIITTNGVLTSGPTTIAIYIDSDGNLSMPPVLPKPPLEKKLVTDSDITLGWRHSWYEIMNTKADSKWYNELWYQDGNVSFTELPKATHIVLDTLTEVNQIKRIIEREPSLDINDFVFRRMTFTDDTKYEGYIMPYSDVENYIKEKTAINPLYTIEDYIKEINDSELEGIWDELIVNMTDDNNGKCYTTTFDGLDSNTLYFIMIRSYRQFDTIGKMYSTYPSSIICITSNVSEDVEPVPVVPILSLDEISDIYMKVKWTYNPKFKYEIRYGNSGDINLGDTIEITPETIINQEQELEVIDNYYVLKINDLFPLKAYNVWIKAKQIEGTLESAWSNALMTTTKDLLPSPILPPSGIGLASTEETIGKDFITIEWTRTNEDLELDNYKGTRIVKNISYVFEIADNIKFLDSKEVEAGALDNPASGDFLVIEKSIVRALNLKGNTRYYIRIKTRITVKDTKGTDEMIKDSAFSIVKIFTTTSEDEYDSGNGKVDVELEEKLETSYLKDVVDIKVLNDERFINDLILENKFDYTVDFSNENSRYTTRRFTMPINVLKALENRDMNLIIKLKDMSVSIPAAAFSNLNYQNLMKSGGIKSITIQVIDDNSLYYDKVFSKEIVSTFNTKYGKVDINYLDKYMNAEFDITNSAYYGNGITNTSAVIYNEKTGRWDNVKEQYLVGYNLVFKVGRMGKIGVIY